MNEKTNGELHEILSLGAGVQSTALLLMSERGELPRLDCAIFADTGWESSSTYRHLQWLIDTVRTPIHVVSNGNIREDHLQMKKTDGVRTTIPFFVDTGNSKEGRTFRKCTSEYKIVPIEKFMRRQLLGLKKGQRAPSHPVIRQWLGISVDEFQRAKGSPVKWKTHWHPLVEKRLSRADCLKWMEEKGYPTPPESSCNGCSLRHNGAMSGTAYLHRSLTPLRDVDFRNDVDRGQLLLWQDECDGMCGV
jgi:hypothetical protein